MEPVRFADILFILLVFAVTFGILALVNRKRTDKKNGNDDAVDRSKKSDTEDKPQAPVEDN